MLPPVGECEANIMCVSGDCVVVWDNCNDGDFLGIERFGDDFEELISVVG